jgi:hypothetical protein
MSKWNFVAMSQVGLQGVGKVVPGAGWGGSDTPVMGG